jgi:hypothetical protein
MENRSQIKKRTLYEVEEQARLEEIAEKLMEDNMNSWNEHDGRTDRTAHSVSTADIEPLPLKHNILQGEVKFNPYSIPLLVRKKVLSNLLIAMNVSNHEDHKLKKILEKELFIAQSSHKKTTYNQKMSNFLVAWRREEEHKHQQESIETEIVVLDPLVLDQLEPYLLPLDKVMSLDYPYLQFYNTIENEIATIEYICDRCKRAFSPDEYYSEMFKALNDKDESELDSEASARIVQSGKCICHDGKLIWSNNSRPGSGKVKREREYTCCGGLEASAPCSLFQMHVFSNRYSNAYAREYVLTREAEKLLVDHPISVSDRNETLILALDCEMIYTIKGLELARVTVIDWEERLLLDLIVKPDAPITDYNTRYSGIDASMYDSNQNNDFLLIDLTQKQVNFGNARFVTFKEAQDAFLRLFTVQGMRNAGFNTDDISIVALVGHSLENDLRALKVIHPWIIDTSQLFPHPKGPHMRTGLRYLAATFLKEFIQQGSAEASNSNSESLNLDMAEKTSKVGHSSLEDSTASLRLFKYKLLQDRKG